MSVTAVDHSWHTAASSTESFTRVAADTGDTVLVLSASGNRTTNIADLWNWFEDAWGQEAQGAAFVDNAEQGESSETTTVYYDGGDPHAVLMVSVQRGCEFDFDSERVGSVGASYSSSDVTLDLPARGGDLQVVLAFARNSTTLPTSDLGAPTYTSVVSGSAMAAWVVNPGTRDTTTVTMPAGRSGHYVAGANFWTNPALDDDSTAAPGDVWAILEQDPADDGGWFTSIEYVDGTAGVNPYPLGYSRLMAEVTTDGPADQFRWIARVDTDANTSTTNYFGFSNDQGFGQDIAGTQGRMQVYAPWINTGSWSFLRLLESVSAPGNSYLELEDLFPASAAATRFRIYLYKPHRRLTRFPLRQFGRGDRIRQGAPSVFSTRSNRVGPRRLAGND